MGRSNDDVTLADLDTDAAIPSNEPGEVKARNKFFHPSTPQNILDEHEALLKLNPEYKTLFDQMEELYTPLQDKIFEMETISTRASRILEARLGVIPE